MSSSNNRFGRRADRQNDDLRAEPVLSFNPKRPPARDGQNAPAPDDRQRQAGPRIERDGAKEPGSRVGRDADRDPIPSFMRGSHEGPRVDREDAEEFGMSGDAGPRIERNDEFDPRARRERALDERVPAAERPLYHHLFDEEEKRGRGFGWMAALGSVAVIAIGAAYAWHNFMARPAPAGLFEPPGFATRGNTGYTTPPQPTTDADKGADTGSTPAPLAATPPAASDQQPTRDVASTPAPKSVPYEPPPPPKKTISEAAANPGSLGLSADPAPAPTPPPAARKEPAVTPAQIVKPPKRETPREEASITPPKPTPAPAPALQDQDASAPAVTQPVVAPAQILTPPKRDVAKSETPKRATPRKEASITPPKPAPAPAPEEASPPAVTQPAAAPAVSAPPPRQHPSQAPASQATGRPQQLNRDAPATYAPPQQQPTPQQPQPSFATRSPPPSNFAPSNAAPSNVGPAPGSPDTVTVDGVTYVSGQEPRSLGTLNGPPPAVSNAAMAPGMPTMPPPSSPSAYTASPPGYTAPPPSPAYTARPYTPADHDGGAPLPNDVIILPNGQMAVPTGQR